MKCLKGFLLIKKYSKTIQMFHEIHRAEQTKPCAQGGASDKGDQGMQCLHEVFKPLERFGAWDSFGLGLPVFCGAGNMKRVRFPVLNGLSEEQELVIDIFPVDPSKLPGTQPKPLCRNNVTLLGIIFPGNMFSAPPDWIDGAVVATCLPDDMWVVVVFAMEFDRYGMKKYQAVVSRHEQREKELKEKQLALERKQAALEKKASQRGFPDVASMQAADAKEAAEQAEAKQQQKQLALLQKQAALEKEASQRGFPDVASMLAADAKEADAAKTAKQQQREAEKAERDRAEAAAEAAEKAKKAEKARLRKAVKEAEEEAERQAKFGNKKGSPPPSSGSSRSTSASPPPPSGGQAVGRR